MQALRLASLLALVAAASGCGGSGGGSNVAVSLTQFGFTPSTLNVRVGSGVTFTNNDTKSHTVHSNSCPDLNGSSLGTGKSYSVSVGTAARSCDIFDTESLAASNYTGVIIISSAG